MSGGASGNCTVWAKGKSFPPQYAGLLNAAYAHTFDFDDTHAQAVLHPGCTAIPAAIAQAQVSKCDGKTLLIAIATGYEVTCRISRALGGGGYVRGFHNTGTAGVFGAIAAISVIKGVSQEVIRNAFGIGASQASGSMQFLDNGAWNKRLHPGFAVHNAFVAVALAEAGVVGSTKSIEGRYGFLNAYSASARLEGLTEGLGSNWIFDKTAIKPFPACRMTHSAIELAAQISKEEQGRSVKEITVRLSPSCWNIVGRPDDNRVHPKVIVDAQFSIYYQTAVAWLYGMETGWSVYQNLENGEVNNLCDNIKAVSDDSVQNLEARLTVEFDNGETRTATLVHPLGEEEHPFVSERIEGKFMGLVKPVYAEGRAKEIVAAVKNLDSGDAVDFAKLL